MKDRVARIEIGRERIRIQMAHASDEAEPIEIPIRLGRRGGRVIIMTPNGQAPAADLLPDQAMVKALVRAHAWRARLTDGRAATMADLAAQVGCTKAYVRRILRLAFLAPDITEAILRGGQPRELTLTVLTSTDLPDDWCAQRRMLGFPEPV